MNPMWEYGESVDHNRTQLSCKICGMEMYGIIDHLKYHLAKFSGHEVEIFSTTPPDVVLVAKNSILDITRKKKQEGRIEEPHGNCKLLRGRGNLIPDHAFLAHNDYPYDI
jgi:hypothetical protein